MTLRHDVRAQAAAYLVVAAVILLLPLVVQDAFLLNKYSRYLALGLGAMALSLAWGYAGILNLGHAVFFGLGAYAIAMHLKLQTVPVHTGAAGLPDFMEWNNVEVLPWFWVPFHSLTFTIVAGAAIPMLLALMLGWFMFRARVAGVFVAIITLALLVVVNLVLVDQQRYTGGLNGITDLEWLEVGGIVFDPYSTAFYYLSAGTFITCLFVGWIFTRTKAGLILTAIRDQPDRARFIGYDVSSYQIAALALSAAFAGIGGMLYGMVLEFASPTFVAVPLSLAMVIWCAVGGRNSLLAAALGAIAVNAVQGGLSETFLETWQLILGALFVLVVLFLPKGLVGLVDYLPAIRRPVLKNSRRVEAATPPKKQRAA